MNRFQLEKSDHHRILQIRCVGFSPDHDQSFGQQYKLNVPQTNRASVVRLAMLKLGGQDLFQKEKATKMFLLYSFMVHGSSYCIADTRSGFMDTFFNPPKNRTSGKMLIN